jgi:hypothetical protein
MTSILKVSNSGQDEATADAATLSSPPFPIPYTMTTSYDNKTVLVWLQKQLALYVDLHLISDVRDFTHTDYWFGKPLICLAHRFFPEIMADFLLELKTPVSALTVFKEKLGLSPIQDSKDDLLGWFSQLKQVLINVSDDPPQEQPLRESVLEPLTKLFQQAQELAHQKTASTVSTSSISRRSSVSRRSSISRRSSSFSPISRRSSSLCTLVEEPESLPIKSQLSLYTLVEEPESLPIESQHPLCTFVEEPEYLPTKSQLSQLSSGNASESVKDLMQQALPIWNQWQSSPKPAGLRFSVEATYTALQLQLHKAHPTTADILKELESIQATFTGVGIHDLEARSVEVGKLIDTMEDMLKIQEANETYTALADQYRSIVAWVDEVRIWFAEAERIRGLIEQRNHLLESISLDNPVDNIEENFNYPKEDIDALNEAHGKLKLGVKAFNTQSMTRLRDHMKALISNNQKNLNSPDITTFDRLMDLCEKHAYELRMLTLIPWEESFQENMAWVRSNLEQVKTFVQSKARWKPDEECNKTEIIDAFYRFDKQADIFEQGQFNRMLTLYADMENACYEELPRHLYGVIERAWYELNDLIDFAHKVVDQFSAVTDFLEEVDHLKHEGEVLYQEITAAMEQSLLQANTTELSKKVSLFQENTVQLVNTLHVPYPEAMHTTDQQGNDEADKAIRMVIDARKSTLRLFGEALKYNLNTMPHVLQLQKRTKPLQDEMNRFAGWVDERLKAMDEFSFADKYGLRSQKEHDDQVIKLQDIKDNEFKRLKEKVQSIKQQQHSHDKTNIHMIIQVNVLQEGLKKLDDQLNVLEKALQEHSPGLTFWGQIFNYGNFFFLTLTVTQSEPRGGRKLYYIS